MRKMRIADRAVSTMNCVVAGFPNAGKRSFLASLGRAAAFSEKAEQLRAYTDEATTSILRDVMLALFGSDAAPLQPATSLVVEVKMEVGKVWKRQFHGFFSLLDLPPPGHLDGPSRWMSAHMLVEGALQSDVLIWLIDSAKPRLHDIVTLMQGVRAQLRERSYLSVGRLLLLASKFDVLLDSHPELNGNRPAYWAGGYVNRALEKEFRYKDPRELLTWIEPAAQVRELLGAACLHEIAACFPPDVLLAGGVVSPRGLSNLAPSRVSSMSRDEIELAWVPFGVMDTVRFALNGTARGQVEAMAREVRKS
jgi:hypothetical protein